MHNDRFNNGQQIHQQQLEQVQLLQQQQLHQHQLQQMQQQQAQQVQQQQQAAAAAVVAAASVAQPQGRKKNRGGRSNKNGRSASGDKTPKKTVEVVSIEEALKALTLTPEGACSAMKTPVSVLQELLSRRGITPTYDLVQIEGAIHEPT